jgi:hypothetical protein
MTLTITTRDVGFFGGLLAFVAGAYATFGFGPLLMIVGAAGAAAAKFLEVAPCRSSNASA